MHNDGTTLLDGGHDLLVYEVGNIMEKIIIIIIIIIILFKYHQYYMSVVYIRYLQVENIIMPFSLLHIQKNKIGTDDKAV